MSTGEDLPSQVKEVIRELKELAESNPLEGSFVLVGQNGYLEKFADSFRLSVVHSGLVDLNVVSLVLKSVGGVGSLPIGLGRPELWERPTGETGYEVESVSDKKGIKIEAFAIENEDPTGSMAFVLRQDFTLFYSLFDRIEDQNRVWDDHMRNVHDVVKSDVNEMLSRLRVMKNYLLDYLFIRKKALLLLNYFCVVMPARPDIPTDYFKRMEYATDTSSVLITVARPAFSPEQLIANLDTVRVILPSDGRILGNFGAIVNAPEISLKTSGGLVEMSRVAFIDHAMDHFLATAYFSSDVLKKYEGDKRYRIDDDGGVHYAGVWGIFRGITRLGDEILAAHVGDVAEGLPYDEWMHWASYNIDPLSTDEHRELRQVKPIQQLLNELTFEMEAFEKRHLFFIARRGVSPDDFFKFESLAQREEIVRELKKTFDRRTSETEFLSRTVELYKLCVDSLNRALLVSIIDRYNPHAKLDYDEQPKGSLKLLLTYLELRAIERECREAGFSDIDIPQKIIDYYDRLTQSNSQNVEDFLSQEIRDRVNTIRTSFGALFALHTFRSKAGGAHLGSSKQFAQALGILGFSKTERDFLKVYRELITRLTSLFSQI